MIFSGLNDLKTMIVLYCNVLYCDWTDPKNKDSNQVFFLTKKERTFNLNKIVFKCLWD